MKSSTFQWELEEITNLNYDVRRKIFDKLKLYGIFDETFLHKYEQDTRSPETKRIEEEILKLTPIDKLATIFPERILFVGGGVRDIIWNKNVKDIDIKVDLGLDQIITRIENLGYVKTSNLDLLRNQYYLNEEVHAIRLS